MVTALRIRLDQLLVERGLAESRSKARALIMAGEVTLGGPLAGRRPTPGAQVPRDADVSIRTRPRFVSRGGEKLAAALVRFKIDVNGLVALDVGASTGGFTDCLLQGGAQRVYAVDTGYGQLDARLRDDPRVVSMERVNARHGIELPEHVDIAVADVSFISLRLVLPAIVSSLREGGRIVVLLKPQFEAERGEVGKGGVIRDPLVHARIIGRFVRWAVDHRLRARSMALSPITGDAGNREFLFLLEPVKTR